MSIRFFFVSVTLSGLLWTGFAAGQKAAPKGPPGGVQAGIAGLNGNDQIRLLELKDVDAALGLTADERANLGLLRDVFTEPDNAFEADFAKLVQRKSTRRELLDKLKEQGQKVDASLQEAIGGQKLERYKQIRRRLVGLNASAQGDWEVRDQLALTDEQKKSLTEIQASVLGVAIKERREELRKKGDANPFERKAGEIVTNEMQNQTKQSVSELERELRPKVELLQLNLMTPAQQTRWKALQGEPIGFSLPKNFRIVSLVKSSTDKAGEKSGPDAGGYKKVPPH